MTRTVKGLLLVVFAAFMLSACSHAPRDPSLVMTAGEHMRLAAVYEKKGEDALAAREYKSAVAKDRTNADAHFSLANLLLKKRDLAEAEFHYLKAVELEPGNAAAHNNLGWLYMERGAFVEAEGMALRAAALDPQRKYIYLDTLGAVRMRQGRLVEAEKNFIEAASLVPAGERAGLREIYNHLAELYRLTGEHEKAAEAQKKARGIR